MLKFKLEKKGCIQWGEMRRLSDPRDGGEDLLVRGLGEEILLKVGGLMDGHGDSGAEEEQAAIGREFYRPAVAKRTASTVCWKTAPKTPCIPQVAIFEHASLYVVKA